MWSVDSEREISNYLVNWFSIAFTKTPGEDKNLSSKSISIIYNLFHHLESAIQSVDGVCPDLTAQLHEGSEGLQ